MFSGKIVRSIGLAWPRLVNDAIVTAIAVVRITCINKITNRRRIHFSAKDWAGGSMKVPAAKVTNKEKTTTDAIDREKIFRCMTLPPEKQ
jgi:hypothetical protein